MINKIFSFILICFSMNVFAQKDLKNGFLVLETKDTIFGKLKNKNYYAVNGVKLYQEGKKIRYSKSELSEIHIDTIKYVKSETGIWSTAFFKKDLTGNVNLYTIGKAKKIGGFDNDINIGGLTPAIKFYCSDYPNLAESLKDIDKKNVNKFISKYNLWKSNNPESKSFFENNIHYKPLLNYKISFLLPGAGFELGLSEKITLNTMLKNEFGYNSSVGFFLNPFLDTQLRYFYNIDKRKAENKRTYKYSGNYVCLMDGYFLETKARIIGVECGWQRTVNKHWYYNLGIGAGKWTTGNQSFAILYDFDFGYNF